MHAPVLQGIIDRRLLINFRVAPEILQRFLPSPFRPHTVHGWGMAGICLIRLKHIRPRHFPACVGIDSENAAHRIAVEWDDDAGHHEGVFVPRRDTSSPLQTYIGGRFFPGIHHRASFQAVEEGDSFSVTVHDTNGNAVVTVAAHRASTVPEGSVFKSLAEASDFFEHGSKGWSPGSHGDEFDCLELRSFDWKLEPLSVDTVQSSFFSSAPFKGAVTIDSAFLMHDIPHEWHIRKPLCHHRSVHPHRKTLSAFFEMP